MAHSVSVVKGGRFVIQKIIPTQPLNDDSAAESSAFGFSDCATETTISLEKIQFALACDASDLGINPEFQKIRSKFDVHVFESLPSTSTQLWQMMSQGAGSGTVAIAQQQSCGRGQRGRSWQSEPGGLYLSLALEPDWPITHSAQLTCMSAWGIATAFNNLGLPIRIKWPNDLFFEGKKLGGILTETKLAQSTAERSTSKTQLNSPTHIKQAVIGVGINWHNLVPETGITLSKILELVSNSAARNKINCLEMLVALVLKGMLQGYFFQQQVGSQVFMKAYSDLLTQVGEIVSLNSGLLDLAVLAEQASGEKTLAHQSLNGQSLYMHLLDKQIDKQKKVDKQKKAPSERQGIVLEPTVKAQLAKRSGEIIGVSEEGYLKVALSKTSTSASVHGRAGPRELLTSPSADPSVGHIPEILLFKPSEIYIR